MGACSSYTSLEIQRYLSIDIVKTLNDRSDRLQKQLRNSKLESNKFAKLIEISLKQNIYFSLQFQNIFQRFNLNVPEKFIQVNNHISQDLRFQFQQFQRQYQTKTKQIIQLNQTINFLNQRVIYLQKLKTSNQQPKVLSQQSQEKDELDRLNTVIQKYQQNEQEFKAKIKNLEKSFQIWRKNSIRLSQLNSELQSNNLRKNSSFFEKQDESINQLKKQKFFLQDEIKEYKILLKSKLELESQYQSKIQEWKLNDEERKKNQQSYLSYLNQGDDEISDLKVQIQNLQSEKQKLQRQLQGIKRLESSSQNEITKLKTQISITDGEKNRLNLQVDSLRRSQQQNLKKSKLLTSQLQVAELNSTKVEIKLLDLKTKQKISIEQVKKMQQKIKQLEKEIIDLKAKYNKEIKSLSSRNSQQTQQLQIQLCLQKSQNDSMKQQYNQKIKNLQDKINELQQSIKTAQSKTIQEFTETQSRKSQKFDDEQYEENLNNYKEKLQDSKWEIDQLKSKVESQSILLAQKQVVKPKIVQLQSLPKNLALINQLGQKKLALQAKIKQNEVLLLSLTNKISTLQTKNLKLQSQAKASQINLANLKTKLQRMQLNLKDSQQLLKTQEQQLFKKQTQILQKQNALRQKQQRVILDKNEVQFQKSQLKSKVDQLQKLQNDLKIKQYRLGSSDNLRQDYKSQLIQKSRIITELNLQIKALENQLALNKQYVQKILVNLRQMQQDSRQSKQRQKQNKQLFQRISKQLQLKNAELQKAIIQIQKSASIINAKQTQNQQLRQRIVLLSDQISNQKNEKTIINKTLNDEVDERQKRQKQIQILNGRLNVLDQNNIRLSEQVKQTKKININQGRYFSQYFNGHILNINTEENTKWVVHSIQKFMKKQIKSTKIICKMDPKNKNNLHKYIDFIPNIALLGKMQNGQTIIAFSEPNFKLNTGDINFRNGIILGMGFRRIFSRKMEKTNQNSKLIDCVDYQMILGNQDLRIKINEIQFYSKYQKINCVYEEKGKNTASIADMFKNVDQTTKLLDYEFYQIRFEQKSEN